MKSHTTPSSKVYNMDVYITWVKSHEPNTHIVKVVKPKKYKKNIPRIDYTLCEYNAYSDRDTETEYVSVMNVDSSLKELLFLVYHMSGQGGDWTNDYNITVRENMDSLINEATNIYECDSHDVDCIICDRECCKTPKKCKKKFLQKFEEDGEIDYGNYCGECSLTWFSVQIIKK